MGLKLILNGQDRELPGLEAGASLADVIRELGLKADRIAVERNGAIAPRGRWGSIAMDTGDKLEVVHFVGGGCGREGLARCWTATIHNMCYRTLRMATLRILAAALNGR